ncbi:PREDICTED: RRP12-like protein [Papilio xuthus]|uniref:RRP12-like protein n=1 Tax=Papilio xuthus TaxID=66420 RepID=A0AAJ6Z9F3_PAPXU|nr:PREDICTED: RRP12-like protein [Papilio xuthus]
MGKFRSKLKGKSKGKRWQKGQSSNSNPKIQKYREMAKSRFFQENLGSTGLTQQAVLKHDAMMTYGHSTGKQKSESENELAIAKDFESMSMRSGDEGTETEYTGSMRSGTFRTFQTFASDWSQCSNVSFSKLLNRFDSNNAIHKDMLAVLAAVTEVIKEQGGKETSTEYFAALMQTLKASEDDTSLVATLSLLSMGIKSVSQAVLRKQFSDSATIFIELLEKNAQSENGTLLRSIIGCLSVLLRAQEYAAWGDSSTMKVFDSVLAFVLHSKPKVRKSAQHAITAILRGSCFMLPTEDDKVKVPKLHPASNRVAEYCLSQIKPEALLSGHRPVLHILTMLRDVLPVFSKDYIKTTCESILSLMAHNNIYIKTCCMHTLHALFLAGGNLSGVLAAQLSRALLAARPPANDTGQSLAWAAVVQQALCCLARLDLNLCVPNLPAFVTVCVTELWHSDVTDINAAATNALKALLFDCVKPALETEECFIKHKSHIDNIFKTIGTGLDNPFNQALKHVIMTLAVCFEIGNNKLTYILGPLLMKLNERKESHNFNHHKEVEYATGCAVKALGPEFVLTYIPLRDGTDINLDRSWLLPVLREKIINSNLKYFATEILDMATFCRKKSREYAQNNDNAKAHTYELLCNQFWSLLPSFCNNPKDIKDNFKTIARVLGNVLKDNPEFRLSVMQALRKLITCSNDDEDQKELGRFAKNYLPILLNIYMTPAKGGEGEGQRLAALETIQIYLTITDQNVREELYKNAITQLEASIDNHFQRESILDIIRLLILYQTHKEIAVLFDKWVFPLCETVINDPKKYKKAKKDKMEEDGETKPLKYKEKVKLIEMEHKKAYRILEEIFKSGKDSCQQFVKDNYKKIKKMLMNSLNKVADSSKAARLRCIEHLINSSHFLNSESKLIKSAVAESVVCTKDINSKCRQCAFNVINTVGNLLKTQDGGMKSFLEMLSSGLSAPVPRVVCATLRALASALFTFSEDMGLETVQTLLDTVAHKMLENNREVVAGAMSFLKVYTKVLPTEVLAGSLPLIFRTLSKMSEDCKRHARLEVGYFLARMTRKYGADTIEKLVPPEDEVMLKRLRNVRKLENRKKRVKEQKRSQTDSDSDGDMAVKGTSQTLEDILKDSDSEMEYLDEETKPKKAKRTNKAWIQDDVEEIVDLADVSAARKITATDPTKKKVIEEKAQKKKAGGFKTAADGRLIISDDVSDDEEEPRPSGDIDTDTDDTDNEADDKPSKLLKPGNKRRYDDILSIKSGRSIRSKASTASKYKAGGKGIHRPLGSGASVTSAGTEYRSKKAKGDIKKKGKPDPYAYLPLSRNNLNKRKKAITSKQFKGIVKSKTKNLKVKSKRK